MSDESAAGSVINLRGVTGESGVTIGRGVTGGPEPALLLIGHGSRSPDGVSQFFELADLLATLRPRLRIGSGLIEFASPDLDSAVDDLVAAGARSIVAVPLVLLGAGHMKDDGPAALARGRARWDEVGFGYGRDLGVHPIVLSAVEERIRQAAACLPAGGGPTAVVLVGRGSTDPDANADLVKAARLVADHRFLVSDAELEEVIPAFVSLARPSVPEALDRATRLGARRIVVVPYFLFTGVLVERIGQEAAAWAAGHGDVEVATGTEIGPDRRIAELVLERYDEAVSGGVVMNCDGCIYRVRLPGYEDRVGSPVPGMP